MPHKDRSTRKCVCVHAHVRVCDALKDFKKPGGKTQLCVLQHLTALSAVSQH